VKQTIQFEKSYGNGGSSLYLRKIYQERDRLIVILEVKHASGGPLVVRQKSLNLTIELIDAHRKLPVNIFIIDPRASDEVNGQKCATYVQSIDLINIQKNACCLYNGEYAVRSKRFYSDGNRSVEEKVYTHIIEGEISEQTVTTSVRRSIFNHLQQPETGSNSYSGCTLS